MTDDSKKDDANPIRETKIHSLAEYINEVEKIREQKISEQGRFFGIADMPMQIGSWHQAYSVI